MDCHTSAAVDLPSLHSGNFADMMSNPIDIANGDSLLGRQRVSASYDNESKDDEGLRQKTSLYAVANLYQEILGDGGINVGGVDISSNLNKTWMGLDIGEPYAWADVKYSVYGNAAVNAAVDSRQENYQVKLGPGFSMKW